MPTATRPTTAPTTRREEDILEELLQKLAVCNQEIRKTDHVTGTRKKEFMESAAFLKAENTFDSMKTFYLGDERHYANSELRGDHAYFFSEAPRMDPPKQPHAAHHLYQMLPKETSRPRAQDSDNIPSELTNVYREFYASPFLLHFGRCHAESLCPSFSSATMFPQQPSSHRCLKHSIPIIQPKQWLTNLSTGCV
jgi:hypothetical protein